jgi:DNA-binding MarR family transcriptional regulator
LAQSSCLGEVIFCEFLKATTKGKPTGVKLLKSLKLEEKQTDFGTSLSPADAMAKSLDDLQHATMNTQKLLRHPELDQVLIEDLKTRRRRAVRMILGLREARNRNLGGTLFSDPAWSILLDAYASDLDGRRISVSDVCIASAVPHTTALRWLKALEDQGLMKRENDPRDRRRAFVTLTAKAQTVLERLIDEVVQQTGRVSAA